MPFDGSNAPTVAAKMRALFGPNGEHWIQDEFWLGGEMCLIGAYITAVRGQYARVDLMALYNRPPTPTFRALMKAVRPTADLAAVMEFNDECDRNFSDILAVLDRMEELELREKINAV